MAAPGARLALEAAAGSVALGLVTVCLLWAVSLVEGQAGLPPLLAARLVAPLCAAAAIAGAVASSRNTGRWDSWASLGVSPSRQLLPLLAVVLVGALLLPGPWHAAPSELSTLQPLLAPAPVDSTARLWPGEGPDGFVEPDLQAWMVPPSELDSRALLARARKTAPRGARSGVDRAELLRRATWALGWPLAAAAGVLLGLRLTRSRRASRPPSAAAAGLAFSTVLLWLLGGLVLAAYASITT